MIPYDLGSLGWSLEISAGSFILLLDLYDDILGCGKSIRMMFSGLTDILWFLDLIVCYLCLGCFDSLKHPQSSFMIRSVT